MTPEKFARLLHKELSIAGGDTPAKFETLAPEMQSMLVGVAGNLLDAVRMDPLPQQRIVMI
jgi:hypothetical protein